MANDEGLQRTLDEAEWSWLKPHAERDALIIVSTRLDLMDVATKLANDDSKVFGEWIQKGFISKPSSEQISVWDKDPSKRFLSVIIQPYVLIQEVLVH